MNIGIDARFWGLEHAGIGRYIMELITSLAKIDKRNNYLLFIRKNYKQQIDLPGNFSLRIADIKHYTLEEQWLLSEIFSRENIDLLHIPHFNVPLLYRKPFVVTIHDLLWHEVKGLAVTTQNSFTYLCKYLGYRMVVKHALKSAGHILVPSETIKKKLTLDHGIEANRVSVTYEAPSQKFKPRKERPDIVKKYRLTKPYIIFTGSAYPHKNIIRAIEAVKILNENKHNFQIAIVSARSVFLEKLMQDIDKMKAAKFTKILGFVPDDDLVHLYNQATALIQPSLSEGYGLTGLEAMLAGTAVIASDIDIFREIYSQAALYVKPSSAADIAEKILNLGTNQTLRKKLLISGKRRASDFSWEKTARQTLQIYKSVIK